MIEFHQDFIRRMQWLKWYNWHCISCSQSTRSFSSRNIFSSNKKDCSSWQNYLCFALEFCKNIIKHLLIWKNCYSNNTIYVINLQRWKWYKDHWLNIDSLNYESSYLWWVVTQHKQSWLNWRSNNCCLCSCIVSDSAFRHLINLCFFHIQICQKAFWI